MTKVFVDGSGCLKYQILKYFAHWIWNETEQINLPQGRFTRRATRVQTFLKAPCGGSQRATANNLPQPAEDGLT